MPFGYAFFECFPCIKTRQTECAPFHNQTDHVCPFCSSSYFSLGHQLLAKMFISYVCIWLRLLIVYASSFLFSPISFPLLSIKISCRLLPSCHSFSASRSCRNLFQLNSAGPFYLPKVKFNYMLFDEWVQCINYHIILNTHTIHIKKQTYHIAFAFG